MLAEIEEVPRASTAFCKQGMCDCTSSQLIKQVCVPHVIDMLIVLNIGNKQPEQHLTLKLFFFFFQIQISALLCGFSQKGLCCISKAALQLQTCCLFLFFVSCCSRFL